MRIFWIGKLHGLRSMKSIATARAMVGSGRTEHQTTNLGAGGSNPSGRANKIRHFLHFDLPRNCRWADHGQKTFARPLVRFDGENSSSARHGRRTAPRFLARHGALCERCLIPTWPGSGRRRSWRLSIAPSSPRIHSNSRAIALRSPPSRVRHRSSVQISAFAALDMLFRKRKDAGPPIPPMFENASNERWNTIACTRTFSRNAAWHLVRRCLRGPMVSEPVPGL